MSFCIGTFNMMKFSARGIGAEGKDVMKIAEILRNSNFDILAIQEILDPDALKSLLDALGNGYCGSWAKPKGDTQEAEGYAFIWNNRRFELFKTVRNGKIEDVQPFILDFIPHVGFPNYERLTRNPYIGVFKSKNAPYVELRLINTHVFFGGGLSLYVSARKMEFRQLTMNVYPWLSDKVFWRLPSGALLGSGRPAYTILLGDYNLNMGKAPDLMERVEFEDGRRIRTIETRQREDSTLKKPPQDSSEPDENINNYWASNYDHFSLEMERFEGVRVRTRRLDSVRYCKDYREHTQAVSDHVPVFLELDFLNG